jgi:hypothetical protein
MDCKYDSFAVIQGRTGMVMLLEILPMRILSTVGGVASMYELVSHVYVVHLDREHRCEGPKERTQIKDTCNNLFPCPSYNAVPVP